MHPGGESMPGDPNAAFYLDGVYHLHYILARPNDDKFRDFSFVHITSPDMLHWTWQPTKLQPSFTGHGMFSGTGFITKEGKPAVIYHGWGSDKNQIAISQDRRLASWEKPYPVEVYNLDDSKAEISHWDPDLFLIKDTYYALSGTSPKSQFAKTRSKGPVLMRSKDLKKWTLVGNFLRHDMPDVSLTEDISCPNFFPLGDKWMLLCISHTLGCRYYLGEWDAKTEQFVPEKHARMNWRREDQGLFGWGIDFFAPESVLTPDGRRVMWAWCATLGAPAGTLNKKTLQSLPRELSLGGDGSLRIRPLRELETLRYDQRTFSDVDIGEYEPPFMKLGMPTGQKIAGLEGDAIEIGITITREQAERKLFGFRLFSDEQGGGLPILFRPETGTLRVGNTEAPFRVTDLPPGEDVKLRIYIDKYVVEVFANDRQAVIASDAGYLNKPDFSAFSVGAPLQIKRIDMWRLKPTNQGYFEALKNRIWERDIPAEKDGGK